MRDIKEGLFGWYEKGAMQKIESIPHKQSQASCKLIYISICSMSAKNQNDPIVECYKHELAEFASVSTKTVQRRLKDLEAMDIVSIGSNGRKVGGLWEKMTIELLSNNNSTDTQSTAKDKKSKAKVKSMDRTKDKSMDSQSDNIKEKKERKKEINKHDKIQEFFDSIKEKNPTYEQVVIALSERKNKPTEDIALVLEDFWFYWTESNNSGTKQRWQMQKTFDIDGRLRTFFKNKDRFEGSNNERKIIK